MKAKAAGSKDEGVCQTKLVRTHLFVSKVRAPDGVFRCLPPDEWQMPQVAYCTPADLYAAGGIFVAVQKFRRMGVKLQTWSSKIRKEISRRNCNT